MEDSNRIYFLGTKSDKKKDELYLKHRIENLEEEREILFKKIASLTKELMEVHVVYDPLYEKVISAHKTEIGAVSRCIEMDEKDFRSLSDCYIHTYDTYTIED